MRTLAIALLTCVFALAADSPFVGTWTINKSKSKPDPKGPKIESLSTQFMQDGPTLKAVISTNGTAAPAAILDGKEHALSATSINPLGATHYTSTPNGKTINTVFKRDGKVIGTRKTSLDTSDKAMTSVTDGTTSDGQKIHAIIVMDKQ